MPAPAWVAAPLALISAPTKTVVSTWTNTNVSPALTTALTTGGLSAAAQAALLIHRVIGGQTDAEMTPRRELIKVWPATDLSAESSAYIKSDADSKTATAGTVVLMPSFRHANSDGAEQRQGHRRARHPDAHQGVPGVQVRGEIPGVRNGPTR